MANYLAAFYARLPSCLRAVTALMLTLECEGIVGEAGFAIKADGLWASAADCGTYWELMLSQPRWGVYRLRDEESCCRRILMILAEGRTSG